MVLVVAVGLKVTFFVVLLVGFTRSALAVFKIEVGGSVDVVDREESDDPAVVIVPKSSGFKEKSELDACLQDPANRSVFRLKA